MALPWFIHTTHCLQIFTIMRFACHAQVFAGSIILEFQMSREKADELALHLQDPSSWILTKGLAHAASCNYLINLSIFFALTCMSVSWSSSMCRGANMVYQPIVSRMSVGLLAVLPVMVGLLDCMESRTEASIERPSRMHPCRHVLNLGGFD